MKKNSTILAIETSCDDTCSAILEVKNKKFKVLSNIVSSQVKLHQKYGGVYPSLAKREHQKNLVPVLKKVLKESGFLNPKSKILISKQIQNSKFKTLSSILERESELLKQSSSFLEKYQKPKIDAIAVTIGPGLEPCLWVGVNFARALGYFWSLPIIPVNHIEAHILVNFINRERVLNNKQLFPAICLVVSGGHTQLILMKNFGKYKILGETRDDAAGECLDKTARILGLSYPGGPAIAACAAKATKYTTPPPPQAWGGPASQSLPRPMINSKDYDFSFSGLKTAVLYEFRKQPQKVRNSEKYIREMAQEIQRAVIDVLIKKTLAAAKNYKAKTIILGGGVTANEELREQFNYKLSTINYKLNFLVPPQDFCTDNALMTAIAGYYHRLKKETKDWINIKVDANLGLK